MCDIADLSDWEKLGLYWGSAGWSDRSQFRAVYSISRLERLGLIETRTDSVLWNGHQVENHYIRLTDAGVAMQEQVKKSGFDGCAAVKRRA